MREIEKVIRRKRIIKRNEKKLKCFKHAAKFCGTSSKSSFCLVVTEPNIKPRYILALQQNIFFLKNKNKNVVGESQSICHSFANITYCPHALSDCLFVFLGDCLFIL